MEEETKRLKDELDDLLADNPADLVKTGNDFISSYLQAREEVAEIEDELKDAKKVMAEREEALIAWLGLVNLDSARRGDLTLYKRTSTYTSVKDFDALKAYVESKGEPASEFFEQKFKASTLREMLDEAKKRSLEEGKPLEECLPNGLGIYVKERITVRNLGGKK